MKKEYSRFERGRRCERIPKAIGIVISAALIFSSLDTYAFAQNVQAAPQKITAFAALSADIAVQNINVGDPETKIKLPTNLNVALEKNAIPEQPASQATGESATAASVQPTTETIPETPSEKPSEAPVQQAQEASSQETVEAAQEVVPDTPAEAPAETQEQESEVTSEENASGEGSSVIGNQAKTLIDYLLPSIKVHAAAPAKTNTVDVVNGVTWRIDPKLSSSAAFSSANGGAKFVYIPVIPATYTVATAVVLPQIVVNVVAKPEAAPVVTPSTENVNASQNAQSSESKEVKEVKEKLDQKEEKVEEKKVEEKKEDKTATKVEEKKENKKTEAKEEEKKIEEKKEEEKKVEEKKVEEKKEEEKKVEEKKEEEKEIETKAEEKKEEKIETKDEEKKSEEKSADKLEDKTKEKTVEKEEANTKEDSEKDNEKEEAFSFNETISGYNVSINAPVGVFPKGTTVLVKVVSNPRDLIEDRLPAKRNIEEIVTFSISFIYEGKEIEPKDGKVDVSIALADDMKETLKNDSAKLQVFHIEDLNSVEEVKCSTDGEAVTFSADSFSEYTLVTTTEVKKTKLDTPANVHWVDGEALTVTWDPVKNADEYGISVSIDGETGEIITYSTKNLIDLTEIITSQEKYYQKYYSGKSINVKVRADVSGTDKQKELMYESSDYSGMVSKTYSREVVIDPKNGVRIVQSDDIYETLKQGLSDAEIAALNATGKEIVFEITMDDLPMTNNEADALFKFAASKSYNIGYFMDISVNARAGDVSIGVSQTPSDVQLVIDIPAILQKSERTFIILRNHNGTFAEVGRTTENKVTIKTNQFSAYAIAYVDPKKKEESSNENNNSNKNNNNTNNNSNNSSGSSDNGESERIKAMIEAHTWRPTTPDEKWRASFVGRETYKPYVDVTSGYTLHIKNAMQGPKCFAAFSVALDGYTIARTFDVLPNGYKIRNIEKEAIFTVPIPWSMQKAGRDFRLICVTTNGQPVILKDLDLVPGTITVKTSKFYAFALVYKDVVPTGK